jgi:lipopolysaccharide transport system permease protein
VNDAAGGSWPAAPAKAPDPSRRVIYLRDLLRELVVRDLKLRYERSVLGVLWAVVNPLAQLLVFVFIFRHVIRLDIPNYTLFVFSGVVAWNWTREGLMRSTDAITGNRELICQPGFPLALLPVVSLTTPLVDLLVALPLVVLLAVVGGGEINLSLLALPVVIALQFLMLQGLGYLVAAAQVLFRDTSHLLGVMLTLGFYLTPVFYDTTDIPSGFRTLYLLNPMGHVIGAYRSILMHGELPDPSILLAFVFFGGILCWIGRAIFERVSHRFAEEL